jgi:uncharacterized protein YjbI with pentapeptide repeats
MANTEQVQRLLASVGENNGCTSWNLWRSEHPQEKIDLSKAQLSHLSLQGVNLSRANLHLAGLSEADLTGANLSETECSFALFDFADLSEANLVGARLEEASLLLVRVTDALVDEVTFAHVDTTDMIDSERVRYVSG